MLKTKKIKWRRLLNELEYLYEEWDYDKMSIWIDSKDMSLSFNRDYVFSLSF